MNPHESKSPLKNIEERLRELAPVGRCSHGTVPHNLRGVYLRDYLFRLPNSLQPKDEISFRIHPKRNSSYSAGCAAKKGEGTEEREEGGDETERRTNGSEENPLHSQTVLFHLIRVKKYICHFDFFHQCDLLQES